MMAKQENSFIEIELRGKSCKTFECLIEVYDKKIISII